jgi:flagellar M-ring protein FliF
VPRRLADGGATVLVPADRLDDARVLIGGSDIPSKGAVGFELFNKSDMGLTDFAQKINYQRALQGELERTIMMAEGVERARVHLALPERSLFRTDRSVPKAAVEVVPASGRNLDAARVAGIQRLVSSAVPDLAAGDVAVLDGNGRVLSVDDAAGDAVSPDDEQRHAVARYYRARARVAVAQTMPDLRFQMRVETRAASGDGAVTAADGTTRDFSLLVAVATPAPLAREEADRLRDALTAALALDPAIGDTILFQVSPGVAPPAVVASPAASVAALPASAPATNGWALWAGLAALSLAAAVLVLRRRPATALDAQARSEFAARLRAAMAEARAHVRS